MTGWTSTDQVSVFAEHAMALLSADPVAHTIALTSVDWLRSGRTYSDQTPFFAWYVSHSGEITGAVQMTPPYELLLTAMPMASVEPLVSHLRELGLAVPGVRGPAELATAFVAAWTRDTDLVPVPGDHLRLYALGTLKAPEPAPMGQARLATEADAPLVMAWWELYQQEAETHIVDVEPLVRQAISDGLLWLWVDEDGMPVSMAGRKRPVAGSSRIGPVFTPIQHRGAGYGSAVTAACAMAAVSAGAEQVVLFTDLTNPVSNLIYQRIGFVPISDSVTIRVQDVATIYG